MVKCTTWTDREMAVTITPPSVKEFQATWKLEMRDARGSFEFFFGPDDLGDLRQLIAGHLGWGFFNDRDYAELACLFQALYTETCAKEVDHDRAGRIRRQIDRLLSTES